MFIAEWKDKNLDPVTRDQLIREDVADCELLNSKIDQLAKFEINVTPKLMEYIFGEKSEFYIERFFVRSRGSLLRFIQELDKGARYRLIHHIKNDKDLYSNMY